MIGESGCGKSVTAFLIIRTVLPPGKLVDGTLGFQRGDGEMVDLAKLNPFGPTIRSIRGKEIAMIFQEPIASLSPVHTIGEQIVEMADVGELFANPRHPYTEARLSAIPKPDPNLKMQRIILRGEVANPANPPSGYSFHLCCRYAKDIGKQAAPEWREYSPGHFVACHRANELEPAGVPLFESSRDTSLQNVEA